MGLETTLCGIQLKNPLVLSSGPLSHSGKALVAAYKAGTGAVVTKTIRLEKAVNPMPHMVKAAPGSLLNCELWSDITAEEWIEKEIPYAKEHGVVVIGSIGHTRAEVAELVEPVAKAGAQIIELVSYNEASLVPMVEEAKRRVNVPILAKLSPNWPELARVAGRCLAAGASGITAIDSLGPTLRIDISTGRPMLGGARGFGWLSGTAIKPLALRIVAEIAMEHQVDIVGVGGVGKAEDALEMLMVGATAVGICSAAILSGLQVFDRINKRLAALLSKANLSSPAQASRFSLRYLPEADRLERLEFYYDPWRCTDCMRCVELCPYGARSLADRRMSLGEDLCRYCGYCVSICATGALRYADGF